MQKTLKLKKLYTKMQREWILLSSPQKKDRKHISKVSNPQFLYFYFVSTFMLNFFLFGIVFLFIKVK